MTDQNIQEKIENKIIDYIVLGSGGRLIAFKPQKAKNGADLVIKRKGEYENEKEKKSKSAVVKTRIFGTKSKKNTDDIFLSIYSQEEDVDISKSEPVKNFYLLFVQFDMVKQDIDDNVRIIKLDESKKEFLMQKNELPQFFLDLV